MPRSLLLAAVGLPALLLATPPATAEPRDLLDPTARAYPGQVLPAAEVDARRGWLVFSQIDDARDALTRGRRDTAQHLIARAQASVAELRRSDTPDPARAPLRASETRAPLRAADTPATTDVVLPSARVEAQLAQAAAAVRAGDLRVADRMLAEAGGAMRGALVSFDDRHQPAIVSGPPSGRFTSSYGGSGVGTGTARGTGGAR
jgi:hypothetical protein